jgi:hypothetical protein
LVSSLNKTIGLLFVIVTISNISAQQTTPKPPALPSQFDLFVGYTTWLPDSPIRGFHLSNSREGIIVTGTYFPKPNFGIELSGAYHVAAGNDSLRSLAIGPVYRHPIARDFTLQAHASIGAGEFLISGLLPPAWGPQFTIGGGLDKKFRVFQYPLTVRLLQAEYIFNYIHYSNPESFANNFSLNGARVSSGIVFNMGSILPPAPVTLVCTASPKNVPRGNLLTVTAEANNLHRHRLVTYRWMGLGIGQGESNSVVTVDTRNLEPGMYQITGEVSQGPKVGQSAHCVVQFQVLPAKS